MKMKARWPFFLALAVVVYLALSFVFMWPPIVTQQQTTQTHACRNNLRVIDKAKEQWAAKGALSASGVPTASDLSLYIKGGITWTKVYFCPEGGEYTLNAIGVDPTCSLGGTIPRR
jgi:hypothetical protein